MGRPTTIDLGVFAQGELPYPIQHTYYQADGVTPIDLSTSGGWTPTVKATGPSTGPYGQGAVALAGDGSGGQVNYVFDAADFADIGKHQLVVWVTDGTQSLASDLFLWEVYDAPGTTGP